MPEICKDGIDDIIDFCNTTNEETLVSLANELSKEKLCSNHLDDINDILLEVADTLAAFSGYTNWSNNRCCKIGYDEMKGLEMAYFIYESLIGERNLSEDRKTFCYYLAYSIFHFDDE